MSTAVEARFTRPGFLVRMPLRSSVALGALVVVGALVAAAPLLPIANPDVGALADRLLPIGSPGHPLGTDPQGRDMLSRLVWGTRTSLVAGIVPAILATLLGGALGILAGLAPRAVNATVMRVVDVIFAFPNVLFALLLSLSLGMGLGTLIIALTMAGIAPIAKITETEVARVRGLDFMAVARTSGASWISVVVRQLIPVILPIVLAYATAMIGSNIAIAGGLGFIGLGVQPPQPELGAMVKDLQGAVFVRPELTLLPALTILCLAVLFPLSGDGVRGALGGRKERS